MKSPRKKPKTGREIEQAQTLTRMIAGFVHQFRTPLHIISSAGSNLKDAAGIPASMRPEIDLICRSADRLKTAVQNLLTFAKGEEIPWTPNSVNTVINRVADFLKDECIKRGLKLELRQDASLSPIRMQLEWLEEAFLNFSMNSVEAMAPGGTLTIQSKKSDDGKRVIVVISDTGAGMTAGVIKHLGQAFQSGKKGGVGLGVYFALEILKRHKAKPVYTSVLGEGTTLTIAFD